ncbi:hypothetical protein [Streptomyces sp. NPDC046805]
MHYRIRKAEQLRGRPLTEGRMDVEVALMARALLWRRSARPDPRPLRSGS